MKSKLGYVLDNFFTIFVVFLVTFVWVRHYIHNTFWLIAITFVISLVISFVLLVIFDRNRTNKTNLSKENENSNNIFNSFLFMDNAEIFQYLKTYLNNFSPQIEENYILLSKNEKSYILIPIFISRKITKQDYIKLYKEYRHLPQEILVLSQDEDKECIEFRNNLEKSILFIKFNNFYRNYLTNAQVLTPPYKKNKKKKFNEIMKIMFNKKQTKKYFSLTLLFCIYAFLFRYSIYYLICGLFLAMLTIYSLKNKRFNEQETQTFII